MSSKHAVFTLYTAILLLSFNGLFAKLLPSDALTITQLRSVVACFALLLFLFSFKQSIKLGSLREYVGVYALGVIVGAHWATFFHAMQVSTIAIGMLAFYSYPVITVFLEPFFSKKTWLISDFVSAALVVIGILILVDPSAVLEGSIQNNSNLQGALWGVFSALLMSTRNMFQKYTFAQVASSRLMLHQIIAICIVGLPFLDIQGMAQFTWSTWGLITALGLVATAGGQTLIVVSLKSLPATSVAMISCLQPLFAIFLAWLVLGDVPEANVFLGGAVIISVALVEGWRQTR